MNRKILVPLATLAAAGAVEVGSGATFNAHSENASRRDQRAGPGVLVRGPTLPCVAGALATAGVAVVLLVVLNTGGPERMDARIGVLALVVALLVAAARAGSAGTMLSRLSCALLTGTAVAGTVLGLTGGLPGSPPSDAGATAWAVIGLGCLVQVLLAVDEVRQRRRKATYAA